MKMGKLILKKNFANNFLVFTFLFAIAIYVFLIGFIYWMSRNEGAEDESC